MDLRAWARAAGIPSTAPAPKLPAPVARRVDSLPPIPGRRGRVEHPFGRAASPSPWEARVGNREIQERIAAAEVRRVKLVDLVANQGSVKRGVLIEHVASAGSPGADQGGAHLTDVPIVVRVDGENVLYDGHTRSCAAWCRGETEVRARIVDLDCEPRPSRSGEGGGGTNFPRR